MKRQYELLRTASPEDDRIPSAAESVMDILKSTDLGGMMQGVVPSMEQTETSEESPPDPENLASELAMDEPAAPAFAMDEDAFMEDQDESIARAMSLLEEDEPEDSNLLPQRDELDFSSLKQDVEKLGGGSFENDGESESFEPELLDKNFDFDALRQTLASGDSEPETLEPDAIETKEPQYMEERESLFDTLPPPKEGEDESEINELETEESESVEEDEIEVKEDETETEESELKSESDAPVAEKPKKKNFTFVSRNQSNSKSKSVEEPVPEEEIPVEEEPEPALEAPAKITKELFEELTAIETVPEELIDSHLCDSGNGQYVEVADSLNTVPKELLLNFSVEPPTANEQYTDVAETLIILPTKKKPKPREE